MNRTKNPEKTLLGFIAAACYACSMAFITATAYALLVFATSAMVSFGPDLHFAVSRY